MRLNKLHNIVPIQLELVAFLLLIFIIWYTYNNFPSLPDAIPTHFNLEGTADGWGRKGEIFIIAGTGIFTYLLITGVGVALSLVKDPKTLINLPNFIKDRISSEKAEDLRNIMVRCLYAMKLLIMSLYAFLVYGSIQTALNNWSGLGYWPVVFIPLILGLAFLMVYHSLRLAYSK